MKTLAYFLTPTSIVIEVFRGEDSLFDLIDDVRIVRQDQTDEQFSEAAVVAVAEMAEKHGVGVFGIRYDVQGEADEIELLG